MRAFFSHLSGIFTGPGFNQTPMVRRVMAVAFGILALVLAWTAWTALTAMSSVEPVTTQQGEQLLFAVNAAARLKLAILIIGVGLMAVAIVFQAFDRTRLGERLLHWSEKDTEQTEAAKTLNSGIVFASIFLGIFFVLAQVIR